jgi:hypothetical protein
MLKIQYLKTHSLLQFHKRIMHKTEGKRQQDSISMSNTKNNKAIKRTLYPVDPSQRKGIKSTFVWRKLCEDFFTSAKGLKTFPPYK